MAIKDECVIPLGTTNDKENELLNRCECVMENIRQDKLQTVDRTHDASGATTSPRQKERIARRL